ncbi:MAG: anti-sigma factor, partial [Lysobacteraceae bacterium]
AGGAPPAADRRAGESVLGVRDAYPRRVVEARIDRDPGFARLVAEWERRLAPRLDDRAPVAVPAHLWPRGRTRLGGAAVGADAARPAAPSGLWQNVGFWRAAAGLAAAAALIAIVAGPMDLFRPRGPGPVAVTPPVERPPVERPPVEDPSAPKPVTTLAHDDGSPGWLASVDARAGTVLMVPVPAPADARGREPELWLIAPGDKPKSLGIVSINRSHTVKVPDTLRAGLTQGAVLAITLEPHGGAPHGVATGPVIAKGEIATL